MHTYAYPTSQLGNFALNRVLLQIGKPNSVFVGSNGDRP